MSKNHYITVLQDIGIDYSDMETDSAAFCHRCVKAAKDLAFKLDRKETMPEKEASFKKDAYKDVEAAAIAKQIFEQIMNLVVQQTPEVLANLLPMFPEITASLNAQVRSASYRGEAAEGLSKKHLYEMYNTLRKCHEAFVTYKKLVDYEGFMKDPTAGALIPAKSGNYGNGGKHTLALYKIVIDGDSYINPFEAARILDVKVTTYMDMVEMIRNIEPNKKGKKVLGEFTVSLEAF